MLDITAETKKVREDMEKQGYVLTEEEYQIILEYTIRKSDRCGKGRIMYRCFWRMKLRITTFATR